MRFLWNDKQFKKRSFILLAIIVLVNLQVYAQIFLTKNGKLTTNFAEAVSTNSAIGAATFLSREGKLLDVNDFIPTITSGTAANLVKISGIYKPIYTILANANNGTAISYAISGADVASLSLNTIKDDVTLNAYPDYETKSDYSLTVTASNAVGESEPTTVTFSITD